MARSQMQMAQTRRLYNYGLPLLRHKQCFGCCWQYLKSKLLIIKIFLHSYLYYYFDDAKVGIGCANYGRSIQNIAVLQKNHFLL